MTPAQFAVIVLIGSLGGIALTGLIIAGLWIHARFVDGRAHTERVAADTFVAAADVARAESAADDDVLDAWLDESVAMLDDALVHLERLRRAAS